VKLPKQGGKKKGMRSNQLTVFFPDAWSGRDQGHAEFWAKQVRDVIESRGGQFRVVLYHGDSLADYADSVLQQLEDIEDNAHVIGLGYSLGGQVLRLVNEKRPGLFSRHILLATSGPNGVSFKGFCRSLKVIIWRLLLGFTTGQIELSRSEFQKVFFNPTRPDDKNTNRLIGQAWKNSHPAKLWPWLEFYCPGLRRRTKPLSDRHSGTVDAIRIADDIFCQEKGHPNEKWRLVRTIEKGGHGAILNQDWIKKSLGSILDMTTEY